MPAQPFIGRGVILEQSRYQVLNAYEISGLETDIGVWLDQHGYATLGCPICGPDVVEGGEVVVNPDDWGRAEPGIDVIAFPEVAVGVAGGDLESRQVEVGEVRQAQEGSDDRGGVLAPARAPHRVTRPLVKRPVINGPWLGLSQMGTGSSGCRPTGRTVWRTWVSGVVPSAAGKGMRTPSMSSSR